ncbi:flagellar basal body rod C-terminal domain-containing protein [Alphaproteobacteria bacterium LSUCC0719]
MADLFDIGRSGLNSYRQSLAITGQNIANINTDGYKRRGAELEEISSTKGSVLENSQGNGMGVRIGAIRRAFDEFLLTKARSATAYSESSTTFAAATSQIEDILLPGDANLGNALAKFFEGLHEVASDPADLVGRTVAMEQAKLVSENFRQLHFLLEEMKDGLFTQTEYMLDEVNLLTAELQLVNKQLSAGSQTKPNNSLLDARDNLIDKLNKHVEVNVSLDERGAAKVILGDSLNGPEIVSKGKVKRIGLEQTSTELLFFTGSQAEKLLTKRIDGGAAHGLSSAYLTAVEVSHEIDKLAFDLIKDVNAIHKRGLTLEGEAGGDFFQSLRLDLSASAVNTGNASATLKVIDPDSITAQKVKFNYEKETNLWRGTAEDGSVVIEGRHSVSFNGVEITFVGQANQFDEFVYDPVKGSAGGLALALKRPQDIAAASPLIISANPNNKSQVLVDASPIADRASIGSALPVIGDIFSNHPSAVGATEFLTGGSVARIPANVSSIDLLSLAKQSQAQFGMSDTDLANLSGVTLNYDVTDGNGNITSDTVNFNIDYLAVKGVNGDWIDAEQISDLLNRGVVKGTLTSSGASVALTDIGAFSSGSEGYLNFSLTDGNFTSATLARSVGGNIDAVVSASVDQASEIQIFTREGRHIAGTTPDSATISDYQAAMKAENGFDANAVYVGDYLNGSGDAGYLGMTVLTGDQSNMLTTVTTADDTVTTEFRLLDGIDTNEVSINGRSSVAQTMSYEMTIGGITKQIGPADVNDPSGAGVAEAMISKFRADAPVAQIIGAPASPLQGDKVRLTFEGQTYILAINDGEASVSGGEPGRLTAFFDAQDRLHVVSTDGTIGKSKIEVLVENDIPENVDVARRLGLMDGLTQLNTRYSDESLVVEGTGSSSQENTITLTFSEDDTYNLAFIFDDKPDSGTTATTDKQINISAAMSGGNASDIADAINNAISNNVTDGDGGANISATAVATVSGNVVTLKITDGTKVEILRDGNTLSTGDGRVAITPVTMSGASKTLDDAYVSPGYELVRQGDEISAIVQDKSLLDKRFTVDGTGSAAQNNEIKLTFSEDDTYNLSFIFDNKPDSGSTSAINRQLDIQAAMSSGDATAIATAINDALANNVASGADMSGVASVSVLGNEVTLTIHDGSKVDILRGGDRLASGSGQVTIDPTTIGGPAKTLGDVPLITVSAKSLANQRLSLLDLPEEELIIFLGDGGAKRVTMQYDETPEGAPSLMRDLEVRVKDAAAKTIEIFDVETQTSLATRTLDADNRATVAGFTLELDGTLDADDRFNISTNTKGTGDNRNLQAIIDLQYPKSGDQSSGGFQQKFTNAVSRLGAIVQSANIAAEAAVSLREASIEAEAAYSGVNLDTEAANLIQQQQAYQASARILSTARELFDTLLQVI